MKPVKAIALLILLCLSGIGSVWADGHGHGHGHGHSSVHVGIAVGVPGPYWGHSYYRAPYYRPYYYSPPYAPYYPSYPVIIERPAPQVYIEQPQTAAPVANNAANNYWYYCAASNAYYPYVQNCAEGWQQVTPQPPAPQR